MFYARGAEILISAPSVKNLQQLRNKCKILLTICTTSIKTSVLSFKRVLVRDNEANNKQQAINDNIKHSPFFSHSGGDNNGNYRGEYYLNGHLESISPVLVVTIYTRAGKQYIVLYNIFGTSSIQTVSTESNKYICFSCQNTTHFNGIELYSNNQ